ncbi:MAG: N-acetylneuraminate synthase family protein, partial [Bacteroidota bacterium]
MEKNNLIEISGRKIGPGEKPFVIAEIGINHLGDIHKAKMMVYDAKKAGAECVKFQRHVLSDEMVSEAKKVIPGNTDESIWDVMDKSKLTLQEHIELKKLVEDLGMIYLCTPFSRAAAIELNEIGVEAFKIGSGECNNYPLIKKIASFGKPIILSSGMNDIKSIKKAVEIIEEQEVPYAILHCTSMYPTPYEKVRLGAIKDLADNFPGTVLGLSDHSIGNYTSYASVVLGASIIEKHFTSDKNWDGPDVPISIDSQELHELIEGVNAIHKALGGKKEVLPEEQKTIDFAYASVVLTKDMVSEETFSEDNIWVKRPGTGDFLAKDYETILGK